MAIKSLAADLAETKTELKAVRAELKDLSRHPLAVQTEQKIVNQDDEPLTLLEARRMLKVRRNVFLKMVQDGNFKQTRMNERTDDSILHVCYSKFHFTKPLNRNQF